MKGQKVKCWVVENDKRIIITFDKYYSFLINDFIELNPSLSKKQIIFSPKKSNKAKETEIEIPAYSRFERMKSVLKKEGLL